MTTTLGQIALEALCIANEKFAMMAGGVWALEYPIETYLSGKVAEAIWDKKDRHNGITAVTLEEGIKYIFKQGNEVKTVPGEWVRDFRSNGRVDVAVWKGDDVPTTVIEIKKWYEQSGTSKNARRVCTLLEQVKSLESGLLLGALAQHWVGDDPPSIKWLTSAYLNATTTLINVISTDHSRIKVLTLEPVMGKSDHDVMGNNRRRSIAFVGWVLQRRRV